MDNLSLIYENSLHNKIRRDVLQEFIYQKTNNKHQKAEYMVEHVLNSSELEYLTEQGFLTKIGQGVKNIAKKAAPYAAAGLMAAGAAKGATPIDQQMLSNTTDRLAQTAQGVSQAFGTKITPQQRQQLDMVISIKSHIEVVDKIENKWRSFNDELRRINNKLRDENQDYRPELNDRQIKNIVKLQDAKLLMYQINKYMESENELRYAEGKPDVTVSATRLNSILRNMEKAVSKNMEKGIYNSYYVPTLNKMTEEANALEQEVLNIQKTLESGQ